MISPGGGVKRLERKDSPSVVLGLRVSGSVSLIPPYALMARTGTALLLPRFTHTLETARV